MSEVATADTRNIFDASDARLARARTALFVPATRPERIHKAFNAGADAVIVDLEDAVAPADKAGARETLARVFDDPAAVELDPALSIAVRISPSVSPEGQHDLEWLRELVADEKRASRLDAIVVAKAETTDDLDAVVSALAGVAVPLVPLIESPGGVAGVAALAAHPVSVRLAMGAIDLSLELGCDSRSTTIDYAKAQLVLASALARIAGPLDTPTPEFRDDDLVRTDTERALSAGCTGKLCIHPLQVETVSRVFAPSPEQLEWATRVLEVGDLGQVDGQMVDRPVILRAQQILGV